MGDIINCSWGDHVEWGEGPAELSSPAQIRRAVRRWRDEHGATKIYWRGSNRFVERFTRRWQAPDAPPRAYFEKMAQIDFDEFAAVLDAGHEMGLPVYLYLSIFDEGWPLGHAFQDRSHSWQSHFTIEHPEYLARSRRGDVHHGVLDYSHPEARAYKVECLRAILGGYDFDGLFICTRSQSMPAPHGDWFGFNAPVVEEFQRRFGVDILQEEFDLEAWRRLRGEYLTQLLREIRRELVDPRGMRLAIGLPRGDHIGPPIGNLHIDWRRWVAAGIVDEMAIDQVSIRCPSNWQPLWQVDIGYGYVSNPEFGIGVPALETDVRANYAPFCRAHGCDLYISRLHFEPDVDLHQRLRAIPGVTGLMHSSFRLDNQAVIAENQNDLSKWFPGTRQP